MNIKPHTPKAYLPQFFLPTTLWPTFNKKLQDILKAKTQFEETKPASEPNSAMAEMLELSD